MTKHIDRLGNGLSLFSISIAIAAGFGGGLYYLYENFDWPGIVGFFLFAYIFGWVSDETRIREKIEKENKELKEVQNERKGI